MLCVNYARKRNSVAFLNHVLKAHYSRRSDKNTSSYRVIKTNGEELDDLDGSVYGADSNWELLTPRGFRFYLPGGVGPGWSDVTTTVHAAAQSLEFSEKPEWTDNAYRKSENRGHSVKQNIVQPKLSCVAQECPLLLRKGIEELFPGCLDVSSPQLTIVTIGQKPNLKTMRRNKEIETEKLAKYFVLAASDICGRLKMIGYWADFINPFSGQPHLSPQKSKVLYKTDERFRCLGFKVENRNNCKVISYDGNNTNFVGSLYTTAPASTEFFNEIMDNSDIINIGDD